MSAGANLAGLKLLAAFAVLAALPAGDGGPLEAAPGPAVTVASKDGAALAYRKADRLATRPRPQASGRLAVEADDGLEPDPALPVAAAREPAPATRFDGVLEGASTSMRIASFSTRNEAANPAECRAGHAEIVKAFALPAARVKVLADTALLFQSQLCAANGVVVVTCFGTRATLSPRRPRPDDGCSQMQAGAGGDDTAS